MQETEFEGSLSGQFLMRSVMFLQMAFFVTQQEGFAFRVRAFNAPLLNTTATGVELLLKHALIDAGDETLDTVAKHGHRIMKMWSMPELGELTSEILDWAEVCSHYTPVGTPPLNDPKKEFLEMLRCLSHVHHSDGSLLRYPTNGNPRIPKPGWLIQTFHDVADRRMRVMSGLGS